MERKFKEWFKANEKRFAHGQFDDKQIAYSAWLEGQNQALRIHDVVGRSEQLKAFIGFAEWYKEEYKQHIPLGAIKEYIKSL